MSYAFYTLAALLIVQGVLSLLEGIRFRAFILRSLEYPVERFAPRVAIIAPCKGIDREMEENLRALFNQDYNDYEIIFAIASAGDSAHAAIKRAIESHPHRPARVVIAEPNPTRSQKVNNLLAALDHLSADREALVFVDSDARVHAEWLAQMVAPLAKSRVGAATGYRWYLPARGGFWSAALSAWNGSAATTLGDHEGNFAWGGSTAILRETFDRAGVRASWQHALSDDYALTRAVQQAGLRVHFVPQCLLISREDASLASLLEFTTRQITITRVYRPRVWWTGIISSCLFAAGFFGGLAYVLMRALDGEPVGLPLLMLATVYALGSAKGALRLYGASRVLPQARDELVRLWWMFCLLWPVVTMVFLYNFIRSATTRRIIWRGVCYEMRSPAETVVVADLKSRTSSLKSQI